MEKEEKIHYAHGSTQPMRESAMLVTATNSALVTDPVFADCPHNVNGACVTKLCTQLAMSLSDSM